ncbi:interferon lambda receptor 1 [Nerophis ophidion]|uniref:interferon lambda receptor 1 n=1 Tax=Nerophis ophidion TaxID=159077 RepID=UPI002AE02652|nr:interferon lambda receptor 1 [Nerophis ophidion]
MWSLNIIILLLFCYARLSSGDGKVRFCSKNFYNILHWDPAQPSFPGEKVLYSVLYRRYLDNHPFQTKSECRNISRLHCNLTAETPSVPHVQYQAQVSANGRFHGCTTRLNPIAHTILGKPALSPWASASSLNIDATLPFGPNETSIGDIIRGSKSGPVRPVIEYTLNLTSPAWAAQVIYSKSGNFVINLYSKSRKEKYCGFVVYKPSCELGRPESEMADFCETLAYEPAHILLWLLPTGALLAAVVATSVGALCFYVRAVNKGKLPRSLERYTPTTVSNIGQPAEMNDFISKAMVCTQSEQIDLDKCARPRPDGPFVGPGGYSPQEVSSQPWPCSVSSLPERLNRPDVTSQCSVIYSSVARAVPTEDKEPASVVLEDGANPLLPRDFQSPAGVEDCDDHGDGPLLLQTVRDANGRLQLPSLALELERSTIEHPEPDRKPLLSDLLFSAEDVSSSTLLQRSESTDSGCEDGTLNPPDLPYGYPAHLPYLRGTLPSFFPSMNIASSGVHPSGYEQNGLPSLQDCEIRNCAGTQSNDIEDKGSDDGIFLKGWGLQIRE